MRQNNLENLLLHRSRFDVWEDMDDLFRNNVKTNAFSFIQGGLKLLKGIKYNNSFWEKRQRYSFFNEKRFIDNVSNVEQDKLDTLLNGLKNVLRGLENLQYTRNGGSCKKQRKTKTYKWYSSSVKNARRNSRRKK